MITVGDVARAIVVRTKHQTLRNDGSFIKFGDNAVVMINRQGQPLGNRVLGPISNECRQKRWSKVVAIAPRVI
jgi:large subunit ribosomal protein L14